MSLDEDTFGQEYRVYTIQLVDCHPDDTPNPSSIAKNEIHVRKVNTKKVSPYLTLDNPSSNRSIKHQTILYRHSVTRVVDLYQIHEDMEYCMGLEDGKFKSDFKSYKQCMQCIEKQFQNLTSGSYTKESNIFAQNELVKQNPTQLFLGIKSLKRLLCQNKYKTDGGKLGWLDDEMINFMCEMCNFYTSYNKEKNEFRESTDLIFGKSWDDARWVTPSNNKFHNQFITLRNKEIVENQHIPLHFNRFVYGIRDWFNSDMNHTKIKGIMCRSVEKNNELKRYCVPVNDSDEHWVLLDCILPNDNYYNGSVATFDHLKREPSPSQRWWAKLLGMYHKKFQQKKENHSGKIYCGHEDMNEISYMKEKSGNKEEHSSLNHCVADHSNLHRQGDSMNCGVWVIIELLKRIKHSKIEDYDKLLVDEVQYDFKNIRLSLFSFIMKVYSAHGRDPRIREVAELVFKKVIKEKEIMKFITAYLI